MRWEREIHTSLDKVGPLEALADLSLVPDAAVCHEGLVQARPEVREAEGVLAAQVQ